MRSRTSSSCAGTWLPAARPGCASPPTTSGPATPACDCSQFRFDIVKIDLSLVQEGATRDTSDAVLRSIKDLAERWGYFVIAKGIETPAQLTMVRQLGLGAGQGYLIGRPGSRRARRADRSRRADRVG